MTTRIAAAAAAFSGHFEAAVVAIMAGRRTRIARC